MADIWQFFNIFKESILTLSIIGSIIYINWNTSLIIFIFIILFSLAIYKILKNILKTIGEKRTTFSINLLKGLLLKNVSSKALI